MADLISRAALLHSLNEQAPKPTTDDLYTVNMCIINAPAVDAVPVVHARWIYESEGIGDYSHCSECGCRVGGGRISDLSVMYKYCPNCGAKMDGERRE